jgi:hypothetical protein
VCSEKSFTCLSDGTKLKVNKWSVLNVNTRIKRMCLKAATAAAGCSTGRPGWKFAYWATIYFGRLFTLGDYLLWATNYFGQFFWKLQKKAPKFWRLIFQGTSYICINFDQKWVGLLFGRLFHKLIWPPCCSRRRFFGLRNEPNKSTPRTPSFFWKQISNPFFSSGTRETVPHIFWPQGSSSSTRNLDPHVPTLSL